MLGVSLKKLPLHFSTVSAQQKVLTIFSTDKTACSTWCLVHPKLSHPYPHVDIVTMVNPQHLNGHLSVVLLVSVSSVLIVCLNVCHN